MTEATGRLTRYSHDGLTFDVVDRGPIDGDVVICLHGFPQTASSWDAVGERLVAHGLRVVAPDQRGYSPGARPSRRRDYTLDNLAGDVLALADALGRDTVHIVGHDWGGIVAWHLGAVHPDRVATLTVLSTPHPRAFAESIVRSSQLLHSWYMIALQVPWFPERLFRIGGGKRIRDALAESGMPTESLEKTMHLLAQPAAARAMVNWYRGLPFSLREPDGKITMPTAYIWGTNDEFLGRSAAERTARWVSGPYEFVEITSGAHWLPETHPDQVAGVVAATVAADERHRVRDDPL